MKRRMSRRERDRRNGVLRVRKDLVNVANLEVADGGKLTEEQLQCFYWGQSLFLENDAERRTEFLFPDQVGNRFIIEVLKDSDGCRTGFARMTFTRRGDRVSFVFHKETGEVSEYSETSYLGKRFIMKKII